MRRGSWKTILAALIALACSSESTAPLPLLARISVTLSNSGVTVGQTAQATATLIGSDGQSFAVQGDTVKWSSSSLTIATVSTSGVVTAIAPGTATISATLLGKVGTASLTVSVQPPPPPAPVATVEIMLGVNTIVVAQTALATAILKDASGSTLSGRVIAWTTSSASIATISSTGIVTGTGAGTATITCTSEGKVGSASIIVALVPPPAVASVEVSLATPNLAVSGSTTASASLKDAAGNPLTGRLVEWRSGNPDVATVSGTGYVTGIAFGTASISATSEGKTGSASVTLAPPSIASVAVVAPATVVVGSTAQASALLADASGNPVSGVVTWSSSASAIASVTNSGLITGILPGNAQIVARSGTLSGSSSIAVIAPPSSSATQLFLLTQPAGALSGVDLGTQPAVQIRDASNRLVSGATTAVTATVASGTGILSGTNTVTAVNGVATFMNLRVSGPGPVTLQFTTASPVLAPTTSVAFTVAQSPRSLALVTPPSGAVSGVDLTAQPVVEIRDVLNTVVVGSTAAVTASVGSGSATLTGITTVNAANGVATFANLRVNGSGAVVLQFASSGLTGAASAAFTVTQIGGSLGFRTQPTNAAVSGVNLTTQPVIEVRDASNAVVLTSTAAVTASVASGTGTLSGTTTVNATNGIATFTDLRISGAGSHTLQFTTSAPALSSGPSSIVTVVQTPASLTIQTQPAGAVTGSALTAQPVLQIRDNAGLLIPNSTLPITAALTSGTGAFTGTATVNAVSGLATFTNLRIDGSGTHQFTFSATNPALQVVSAAFSVLVGPPAQLIISRQPTDGSSGVILTTQPIIQVRDVANQTVTSVVALTAGIASGTGVLSGTLTVNSIGGVVTFTDLAVTGGGAHSLKFTTVGPALIATSNSITVTQVLALSRDAGSASGGAVLRISGNGFGAGDAVSFGGTPATGISLIDAFTIQATAPAGTVGTVGVSVVHNGNTATLPNAFEYLPVATTTFFRSDFEGATSLNPFFNDGDSVTISRDVAYSGTQSVKATRTTTGTAGLAFSFSSPLNPALSEPNGIYMRWYMYIPTASVNNVQGPFGQIKTMLFRMSTGSGQPGYLMCGIGSGFRSLRYACFVDYGIKTFPGYVTSSTLGDGVWLEIQTWNARSNGTGRARMWINGKQVFDVSDVDLGSSVATDRYIAHLGLAYVEAQTGPVSVYLDNVAGANGYIDP